VRSDAYCSPITNDATPRITKQSPMSSRIMAALSASMGHTRYQPDRADEACSPAIAVQTASHIDNDSQRCTQSCCTGCAGSMIQSVCQVLADCRRTPHRRSIATHMSPQASSTGQYDPSLPCPNKACPSTAAQARDNPRPSPLPDYLSLPMSASGPLAPMRRFQEPN
jgi:hypothetical protein